MTDREIKNDIKAVCRRIAGMGTAPRIQDIVLQQTIVGTYPELEGHFDRVVFSLKGEDPYESRYSITYRDFDGVYGLRHHQRGMTDILGTCDCLAILRRG